MTDYFHVRDSLTFHTVLVVKMAAVSRVLIVGAGISGALTAALLRKELSHVHISVWEKARGAGMYISFHLPVVRGS